MSTEISRNAGKERVRKKMRNCRHEIQIIGNVDWL